MPRVCVFCESEGNLTNEHVFPQWMSRALNLSVDDELTHTIDMRERGKVSRRVRQLDIKVKVVCKICNSGWMSHLERRVIPILTPMIQGVPLVVGADDARAVGCWITKTALMTAFASPGGEGVVSQEMLSGFYRDRSTFPAQSAWVGRAQPTEPPTAMQVIPKIMKGVAESSGTEYILYDWMAFVGNLVMRTVIVRDYPWHPDVQFTLKAGAPLLSLGGANEIHWPPRGTWIPDAM